MFRKQAGTAHSTDRNSFRGFAPAGSISLLVSVVSLSLIILPL